MVTGPVTPCVAASGTSLIRPSGTFSRERYLMHTSFLLS